MRSTGLWALHSFVGCRSAAPGRRALAPAGRPPLPHPLWAHQPSIPPHPPAIPPHPSPTPTSPSPTNPPLTIFLGVHTRSCCCCCAGRRAALPLKVGPHQGHVVHGEVGDLDHHGWPQDLPPADLVAHLPGAVVAVGGDCQVGGGARARSRSVEPSGGVGWGGAPRHWGWRQQQQQQQHMFPSTQSTARWAADVRGTCSRHGQATSTHAMPSPQRPP